MKSIATCIAFFAFMSTGVEAFADERLTIGSPAPPIKVATWIKGPPVTAFEKGKVYVVVFHTTAGSPYDQAFACLTDIAKKYEGKLTLFGVDVWEKDGPQDQASINKKVADYANSLGNQLAYRLAVDDTKDTMARSWVLASGTMARTCFIVNRDGKIAWIGHAREGIEKVLDKVIAGTFDLDAYLKEDMERRVQESILNFEERRYDQLWVEHKYRESVAEMDKAFAKYPKLEFKSGPSRVIVLSNYDEQGAYEYASKLAAGIYKDQVFGLATLAMLAMDDRFLPKTKRYDLALKWAEQGAAIATEQDYWKTGILHILAQAHFKVGHVEKAIEFEEKALANAKAQYDFDPAIVKEYTDRLALYKTKKG